MVITLNPGQTIAGPDVVGLGNGVYELPDAQGAAAVKAGHAAEVKAEKPKG